VKQANCRRYGAKVVLHGNSFAEAKAKADEIMAAEGQRYIHGYDDPAIIAGAGTLGLEILEQCPEPDAFLVPVGGGGLIAGVSVAVKERRPRTEIIGVESVASQCFGTALATGHPIKVESQPTLADGLAVSLAGELALSLARPRLDRFIHVSEAELALAVVRLMEWEKAVVEGAGAAPLAAFLSGKLVELHGKRVVLLLGGGNIDLPTLPRLIDSALVADGRLARFTVVISDRPGGLAKLAQLIAEIGVSVKEIEHDREFCGPNIAAVQVRCTVESRDAEHVKELYRALTRAGFEHFAHEGG
jgi:threonine dehydratase